ncbi:MAG: gene transfer agent family protein [Paracoccaceae bacterium]
MANRFRGEVTLGVNGSDYLLRLTLGALAELEERLQAGSLLALVERFEAGTFTTADLLALLEAGLRGGGCVEMPDLGTASIEGGPVEAARVAARLLARSFSVSDERV